MRFRMRGRLVAAIFAAGLIGTLAIGNPLATAQPNPEPAPADPFAAPAPPPVDPMAPIPPADPFAPPAAIPQGTPAGQNPTPFTGQPPFLPPSFNPTNGSIAGAAKPIYINFQRPIADRQMAQDAVHKIGRAHV